MSLASIIITTHDRPHLLPRAVQSARAAGTDLEVIVVDDASTDETAGVCKTLSGITYVRLEHNQRVAGARNVGLLASSGEYVTFLDDDDQRLPNSVDEQIKLLHADDRAGLIYGQAIMGDQSGKPTNQIYPLACPRGDIFWNLLGQNFIPCGSVVFRRSCLNRIGLLDDKLSGLDDWDFWIRIAELYSVLAIEQPVMIWRRSTPASGQGTSQAAVVVAQAVRQFRQSWMKLPRAANGPAKMRRAAWLQFSEGMSAHLVWEAMRSLRRGEILQALRNIGALSNPGARAVMRLAKGRNSLRLLRTIVGPVQNTSAPYSDSFSSPSAPGNASGGLHVSGRRVEQLMRTQREK